MNAAIQRMREKARARSVETSEGRDADSVGLKSALDRIFPTGLGEGYSETRGFVKNTPEFRRVAGLPKTDWHSRTDVEELIDLIGLELGDGSMRLRPVQAVMLEAMHDHAGAFGAIGVGEGKTLISYLAPTVLGAERMLLLVPAKLRDKTYREFEILSKSWKSPIKFEILSYEMLGRVSSSEYLSEYAPDLIVADEAHRAKNKSAACTRRLVRFLIENPKTVFVPMSGTVTSRSIMDFHHLLALSVGPETMPLPAIRTEAKVWANAVDEKASTRARPGALKLLLDSGEDPSLEAIREAVGLRIFQTAGVINTTAKSVEASLVFDFFDPKIPKDCRGLIRQLTKKKLCPNGDEALPIDVYRHTRTLVSGFYYQWDPEPPIEWRTARSDWRKFVVSILDQEDARFDSELQVAQGCDLNWIDSAGTLWEWRAIRDTFRINSVPVWISDDTLKQAIDRIEGPTIVWVEHQATGQRLAELTGWNYYRNQGLDSEGNFIDDHPHDQSLIASIAANSEGRNLQGWSRNLVITPPANGRAWEQLLGRTHRPGQLADEVSVDVMIGNAMIRDQLGQAFADARFIQSSSGQPQKLLFAGAMPCNT